MLCMLLLFFLLTSDPLWLMDLLAPRLDGLPLIGVLEFLLLSLEHLQQLLNCFGPWSSASPSSSSQPSSMFLAQQLNLSSSAGADSIIWGFLWVWFTFLVSCVASPFKMNPLLLYSLYCLKSLRRLLAGGPCGAKSFGSLSSRVALLWSQSPATLGFDFHGLGFFPWTWLWGFVWVPDILALALYFSNFNEIFYL